MDQKEILIESTEAFLCSLISEVANLTITDNDSTTPFQELGIDSFRVLQVIKKLEEEFGTLPKTLLFENFNISDLSNYFVEKHPDVIHARFGNQIRPQKESSIPVKQEGESSEPKSEDETPQSSADELRNPIIILEKEAIKHLELKDWYYQIFNQYKNEGSASRGTRNIAPFLFIGSEKKGYLNYSKSGNIILVYAFTGPGDYFPVIAEEIYQYGHENGFEITMLSDHAVESIGNEAFYATPFGIISRIENIKDFTLEGKKMRRLRYQVSKFEKSGVCSTVEYENGKDKDTDQQIARLIDEWSAPRTMVNPLIKIVREEIVQGKLSKEHRLFLTYLDNKLQNAILISKLSDELNGYLMDLEFYPESMPLGGLEYGIVKMMEILAEEGADMLSLGGTYGCKLEDSDNADPELNEILGFLRDKKIFNDEGNLQFKNKFRPTHQTIFICRPKSISNADNVTDVIMMIADPSNKEADQLQEKSFQQLSITLPKKEQEEKNIPKEDFKSDDKIRSTHAVDENELVMIEGKERSRLLAEFHYNPLHIPNNKVEIDLKTDSWAQLKMPAIDNQLRFLHSQLYQPVNIEEHLKTVFPFSHLAITSSGRNAEQALFKSWPKNGIVIQNILFPTAIYNQIENNFSPAEIPADSVFQLRSEAADKGNIKWEALVDKLEKDHKSVSFVAIELANNAAGGAPVSVRHLREIKNLLSTYSVPLVIDGTRILENASYVIKHEKEFAGKDIWEVARTILSIADIVWASLAKDFCINKGGIVATNDGKLYDSLQEVIQDDSLGLDIIDKKLIAHSFRNRQTVEHMVSDRMKNVQTIHQSLTENGVPVINPAGVHAVLIDVKQVPQFSSFEDPVASFVAWLFLNTGIRGGAHSVGMQKDTSLNQLVRLAIPLGLNQIQVDEIKKRLVLVFQHMENIPEIALKESDSEKSLKTFANYQLKKYHNVSQNVIPVSKAVETNDKEQAEVKTTVENPLVKRKISETTTADSTVKKQTYDRKDIAIVGMSGRYPKARNLDQLWENLLKGKDCVETIPEERLRQRKTTKFTKKYRGGFLSDVDKFDSMFFNIPPAVAEMFDPSERLLLETAWESIEDAGYYPEILTPEGTPKDIGVFIGAVWTMYQVIGAEEKLLGNDTNPNSFLWSMANRISYCLNLNGPSLSVDTACSSSMTALYLACEAIYKGECSGAIVGGVNLDLHQSKFDINSFGGALSPDGVCRTFGKGANGYVAGEGVGAIFIKSLEQAEKDGDYIHGVIKGVSVNHGGRTSGYMVPDPKAQGNLVINAMEKGGIDARTIGYIEAHGTGTELGDPIEISGLTNAFQKYTVENQSCAIGSVKTNIGHLEAAAGIVGIHKVLLQMKHKKLVPSLHSSELNEFIDFENSPFYVEQEVEEWKPKVINGQQFPLRAGISSFGAGGANAHVVIESYDRQQENTADTTNQLSAQIFPLSAVKEDRLYEAARRLIVFLEADLSLDIAEQKSIKDIGFTLRVGRKSFEHRLVIIAVTKEELLKKLKNFIDKKKDDDILSGVVQSTGNITRLLNKREKQAFVQLIADSGDLRKLGQLWIEGVLNDWQGADATEDGKRIPLPTYPFADKRHWVERAENANVISASSVAHPLIDINESTFERQIFRKTFHDKEFFIYDHLVSDIPTLPGVAYLDFARKAGELAAGRRVKSIKNIIWLKPISVENSEPVDVWIELLPQGGEVKFEVFGKNEEGVKQLHSQGKLTYFDEPDGTFEEEFIDIKSVQERCVKVADGEEAYPLFKNMGLGLGPSFQVLQEVYKNEDEMFGIMKIPEACEHDFYDFMLHPSLVDGAGQTVMATHLTAKEASGELFVPYSFGEVEIHAPLTPTCYSYIRKVDEPNSKLSKANLIILDEDGKVLVKINESIGIPLTDVHEKPSGSIETEMNLSDTVEDGFSKLYYTHTWEEASIDPVNMEILHDQSVILFDTDDDLYNAFKKNSGIHVILVQPGKAFETTKKDLYKINPNSKEDFIKLIETLRKEGTVLQYISFAWSKAPFENAAAFLEASLEKGVYSFLYLCQALVALKSDQHFNLMYLYNGTIEGRQPQNEAINGFAKSLLLEHSNMHCKTLEFQGSEVDVQHMYEIILSEIQSASSNDATIRYQEDQRLVRKLTNINPWEAQSTETASQLALKEKGVYLITGGAGGLGLIFAEYLAKQCKARLILTGRSELSEEKASQIKEIEAIGAEVLYVPTDVANYEDVKTLVSKGIAAFGELNGIIHSAGVLRDSSLRNKTKEEMSAVFAPKVFGTFYLDEATKDLPLDFFVTFSSMAAVGGNMGQSDYSYANHFMDTYAQRRAFQEKNGERSGKSLSLNWSIWADGGMKLDTQMEAFFKNSLGIRPLNKKTGTEAFVKGLLIEENQMVVVEGMQERMEIAWGIREKEISESAATVDVNAASSSAAAESDSEAATLVQENLIKIAMDFLKLEEDDVSLDKILLDIGFDSIGLASYANSINDIYGTDVTPVLFFEYPSIREITKYLATEKYDLVSKAHGLSGNTATTVEQETVPQAKVETEPAKTAAFSGINKGWNVNGQHQQTSTQSPAPGLSADSRFIDCPIAIVGIGGVMPKSRNMHEYWDNLKNEENMISVIPRDRWIWEDYDGDPITEKNKTNSKYGGFIEDADKFDPLFFGISPREAEMMDPQQRVFLETVWNTIEDSGYKVSDLSGTKTGLFVGVAVHDYTDLMNGLNVELDGYTASGNSHCILANRISFLLNLRGPSAPIDTACSSSLIAIHRAIESIHTGSSDMAIVGGVQLMLTPAAHISFGMAGMLSTDGKCKTFDKKASGYVRGEGSGAVFLKPLAKAEEDNDHIYAVIKSTAENHGGKATMLTAPNPHAQSELLVEAYEKAQINPATVGYLECHGTGTSLGDPIEIRAITKAFNDLYQKHNLPSPSKPHIGLSSVKTNIGHLETAAGISSLLKAVLAMKHKHIPASLHFEELNPHINLTGTPFYVVDKTTPWEPFKDKNGNPLPLRAGVSSFGFGGANAHVVIEEYIPKKKQVLTDFHKPFMFVLSAKNEDRLKAYVLSMLEHVEKYDVELLNLTYTLQVGRDKMDERLGFAVNSEEELVEKLQNYLSGNLDDSMYQGNLRQKKKEAKLSGQSSPKILQGRALEECMATYDYSRLLEAWVEGSEIDWKKMYGDLKPERINIPTYPFARESYWFDYEPDASGTVTHSILHPLLHQNTSVLKQQSYRASFNGNEFFLSDYNNSGEKVLSSGAFLEMANQAVLHATQAKPTFTPLEFEGVNWIRPFVMNKTNNDVSIALFEDEDASIVFEVYTAENDQEVINCDGRVLINSSTKPGQIDIHLLKKQMEQGKIDSDDLFGAFTESGFNGYKYPEIVSVSKGPKQFLVHLKMQSDLESSLTDYIINPVLIESAIQTAGLIINAGQYQSHPPTPVKLDRLKVTQPCTSEMYVWVRYARGNTPVDNPLKLDVDLIDTHGNVCITLKSLAFMNTYGTQNGSSQSNDLKQYLESIYDMIPDSPVTNTTESVNSEFERLLDIDFKMDNEL
ncbi:SDR family NAD(P)-dependent oxidoreductase [Flavobacteriaceae bacterium M23B6Z8]